MTDKIARVCDYCGKTDILKGHADSNGMILVQGDYALLLLMRDLKGRESGRPSFSLAGKAFCPECLPKAIQHWIYKVN